MIQDYEEALKDAEKCVELKSDWPKGYLRLGTAYQQLFRYQEASVAYAQGIKLDKEDKSLEKSMSELNALLDELKITQEQLNSSANPESDKFESMIKWLKDGGAEFPMLYLQYYGEDYRGVHSLTKIGPEKRILYVPRSHIMTSEVAKESDIGKKIIKSGVDLRSKHSYLAAYLLQEKHKGKKSFWYPYINILPEQYRNMPIFFQPEELAYLKGSFTVEKISDRLESLSREYEAIKEAVPDFEKYTLHEFIWARLVVITRIFGLVIDDKKTDGLVPYADMLNHKRPRESKWAFEQSADGFTITTLLTIQRGAQVYDSYGRKCNSRFFVNYGFALDENDDNEAVLRVGLPKMDPHYAMKINILRGERNAQREFQVPATYREKKTKEFFSFMRFLHARDNEMAVIPSEESKIDSIEPISTRNEIAVLKHIALVARAVLKGFETTLEEDEKEIEKLEMYSNIRNCYVMRMGEKRVLHWFLKLEAEAIPMLEMQWKDLKKIAAKCYQENNAFNQYITAVVAPLVRGNN